MIAVSTCLRLVLSKGIDPDFTTLIDHHAISTRYFEGTEPDRAPPMITQARASSEAVQAYPGPKLFGGEPLLDNLFDGVVPAKTALQGSGSVTGLAFNFARFMKADPVIFVGLDLSYPGGLLHTPGTSIHNTVTAQTNRFYSFEMRELEYYLSIRGRMRKVPAIPDGEVPTEEVLLCYIKEFEQGFIAYPGKIIDATEGGVRLEGSEVRSLRDVVEEYRDVEPVDLDAILERSVAATNSADICQAATERLDELDKELAGIMRIYGEALPLYERVLQKTSAGKAADRETRKIIALRERLSKYQRIHALILSSAQADIWIRTRQDRHLDAVPEEGVKKQYLQAVRDHGSIQAFWESRSNIEAMLGLARQSIEALGNPTPAPNTAT